jgi:hypothetical protein
MARLMFAWAPGIASASSRMMMQRMLAPSAITMGTIIFRQLSHRRRQVIAIALICS